MKSFTRKKSGQNQTKKDGVYSHSETLKKRREGQKEGLKTEKEKIIRREAKKFRSNAILFKINML